VRAGAKGWVTPTVEKEIEPYKNRRQGGADTSRGWKVSDKSKRDLVNFEPPSISTDLHESTRLEFADLLQG
jgi:hypothetical protein